jgi:hypothetical protein
MDAVNTISQGKGLTHGHDFGSGYFFIGENGERVFSKREPQKYEELLNKHMSLTWPDKRAMFEKIAKLKQEGLSWEDIVPQSDYFLSPADKHRPADVKIQILTRFYDSWSNWLSCNSEKRLDTSL